MNKFKAVLALIGIALLVISSASALDCPKCQKPNSNNNQCIPDNNVACDDGIDCTTGDKCNGGACIGTPNNALCTDDGNVCTDSVCTATGCINQANTGLCDDGIACTVDDVCANTLCTPGTPNNALCKVDDNNVCTDNVCTATGCINQANTGPCDDGIDCTVDDVCADTLCTPGTPNNDRCTVDDHNVCTDNVCTTTGCINQANTGPCDDGIDCTVDDVCADTLCTPGTPNNARCKDAPCVTCDPATGCTAPGVGQPHMMCGGACVNTQQDNANCGGCAGKGGVACAVDQRCTAGVCVAKSGVGKGH